MKNDKYELTDETIEFDGVTLHRIRALRDIRTVKAVKFVVRERLS